MIDFGRLGRLGRREAQGRFDGGSMASDAGVLLLSAVDRKLGLTAAAARCIADPRNPLLIKHAVRDMLRQRVYGLALGWEDLNDHKALRLDVAMQTAVGVDREVASAPTLALAVGLPGYRAECQLGWVLGMSWTFGALLPTFIGMTIVARSALLHRVIWPVLKRCWPQCSLLTRVG